MLCSSIVVRGRAESSAKFILKLVYANAEPWEGRKPVIVAVHGYGRP